MNITELSDEIEFADFPASRQNGFESVFRSREDFKAIAAYHKNKMVASCFYEPQSGDITNIAVAKAHRSLGLGTNLLIKALQDDQSTIRGLASRAQIKNPFCNYL